jgi:DNA-binding LacI/PurR family transcriptional regulator
VYERLRRKITASGRNTGDKLAPVKDLAERCDASVFTVHQALRDLQDDGYVEVRHGRGTFVTSRHRPVDMAETVTLCMHARGHIFSDLVSLLMEHLADRGRIGTLLGMEATHCGTEEMVRRIAHSESRTLMVQAGMHFPFEVFDYPGMRNKNIVAVLSWASARRWDGLYRVVHDREAGAKLVVDHLRQRGHQRVLVIGTLTQISQLTHEKPDELCAAYPFARHWSEAGGQWVSMQSHSRPGRRGMLLDEERFLSFFDEPKPPTAIFGLRDVEAWLAQDTLLRRRPGLKEEVDVIGYGKTTWSEAGHPPIPTVDFDLQQIVKSAMQVLDEIKAAGEPAQKLVEVPPRMCLWK